MPQTYSKYNNNNNNHHGNNKEISKIIDNKTRQLLFFQCYLKLIKQKFLKNNEIFTEYNAIYLLEKYIKKNYKKSKCITYFLIDRIRIKQKNFIGIKPFRKEIIYREIKHFFIFPNYPKLFMLCIIDENKNKRSYELYQCMNYNDVCIICNLTYKASIDIYNILHETISLKQITSVSRSSTNNHYSKQGIHDSRLNSLSNEVYRSEDRHSGIIKPVEDIVIHEPVHHSEKKDNCSSNLTVNYSKTYSVHNNDEKYLIKGELPKSTSNIPKQVKDSTFSDDLQSYRSKFYSLHNVCSNTSEFIIPEINITKNNVHSDYSVCKLFPIPYNNNNSNNNNKNNEKRQIYNKDNKLFEQKPLTLTSLSSLSSSTSNEERDLDKYVHTKQDMFSTNYHLNSTFGNVRRNSLFPSQNLNRPLDSNNSISMLKTFTMDTGKNLYCRKKDLNICQDDLNVNMNDYDDNHLENKLRKCTSNVDIRSADMTYLCYDPVAGIRINNEGPIYMYMARYNSTVISSSHDCANLQTY
uniref:RGS domain-containing protein n=1 Tax=Schistosoma mansoni TaxID=6183 RepID=A0A5K4FG06_SCHMA